MDAEVPAIELRRPFHWGIAVFCDDDELEPWPEPLGSGTSFAASDICIIAAVHHAHDVELDRPHLDSDEPLPFAEVTVRVWIQASPPRETQFDGILRIDSGKLNVGDADDWAVLDVPPGRWQTRISLTPVEHADEVDVYLNGPLSA